MKNLLNKGLLVKVVCGMLVVTMVGCYSKGAEEQDQQEQQAQIEQQVETEETEDLEEAEETEETEEYEAEDVAEDQYDYEAEDVTPVEQDVPNTTKEEIAEALEYTIANTMGSDYSVEVYMYDENTCRIGVMVNNFSYDGLSTDEIADLCELYGVTDNCTGVAINAEAAFEKAGYNVKVNVLSMDCVGTAFMMVDSTGYAIYY